MSKRGYLWRYGKIVQKVKVVQPQILADAIVKRLRGTLENYGL